LVRREIDFSPGYRTVGVDKAWQIAIDSLIRLLLIRARILE